MRFLVALAALMLTIPGVQSAPEKPPARVPIILDTDIGPDVDDAGSVAVLNALADRGEARILAMLCCTSSEWGPPCLDALNTYYGRPDIPIGTLKKPGFLPQSEYNRQVAEKFPNDLKSASNAPNATVVYRKVLAKQPDKSVVICAVGPLPNLKNLLESRADSASGLSGKELVRKKVRLLSIMGGGFPQGKEWNFEQDPAAAQAVARDWPTPILFSGFEIGSRLFTGKRLHTEAPANSPVRAAYALFPGVGKARESWDQTAIIAAVRGPAVHWKTVSTGTAAVNPSDGSNVWTGDSGADHTYLVERDPPEQVQKAIEDLMLQAPRRGKP